MLSNLCCELKIIKKYQRIKGLNILKNNKVLKIKIISSIKYR